MKVTFKILISICLLISIVTLNNCKKAEKNLPELITVAASGITTNSALLGGFITDDGGSEITARGICWGKEPDPEISGPKTDNGKGTGSFTSPLTGLTPSTLYYARAYATNSEGTAFGNEVQFTTSQAAVATVVTKIDYGRISYYGANMGGQVTNDGGASVTEKGICWATSENPTINNSKIIYVEYNTDAYAVYWCWISSLQPKSVYHVRAYAINSIGTSYGDDMSITTLTVPEVTSGSANEITNSSATVDGNVTSLGDASNVEIGICYGTEIHPTVDNTRVNSGATGTGEFACNLTNLTPGTLYYARAYVLWPDIYDPDGYAVYGNEVTFTTR
jgi:hypothetical protein